MVQNMHQHLQNCITFGRENNWMCIFQNCQSVREKFFHICHSLGQKLLSLHRSEMAFSEADKPFCCTLPHAWGRKAINWPVAFLWQSAVREKITCCATEDRSSSSTAGVFQGKSMGGFINHYCEVNSHLYCCCPLFCLS